MATGTELVKIFKQIYDQYLNALEEYSQALQAIDPNSPNARQELAKARQLRDQLNGSGLAESINTAYQEAITALKQEGNTTKVNELTSLIKNTNTLVTLVTNLSNDTENKINASPQSTTVQNNSGTGTPGTAGQGPDSTNTLNQLQEVKVTGVKTPEAISPTDPALQNVGNINIAPPDSSILGGPKALDPNDPALRNVGNINIGAPSIVINDQVQTPPRSKLDPITGAAIPPTGGAKSVNAKTEEARSAAATNNAFDFSQQGDWRVRLSLAPGAKYLYKSSNPGIMLPLVATDGIIFPYTPSIQVNYMANYDSASVQHSNYKIFQYQSSGVDNVTISCDFTAQDTYEANYVLAAIHFLRSLTKMFYGKDTDPVAGIPPPLCYLTGLGNFQFNGHPLVINSFNYNLPTDVDYIQAKSLSDLQELKPVQTVSQRRLASGQTPAAPGGNRPPATLNDGIENAVTYVPTKITMQFTAYPIVARNDVSNNFSLAEYATGKLLMGNKRPNGGGFW